MRGIFGIGNIYRRDDGIGTNIINLLKKEDNLKKEEIKLFSIENDVFSIDEVFSQNLDLNNVLFIDAMKSNKFPLATVVAFDPDENKQNYGNFATITHNIGILEYLAMVRETQPEIIPKGKFTIIGMVVEDLSFKEGISETVNDRIPFILKLISEWINNNDISGIYRIEKNNY